MTVRVRVRDHTGMLLDLGFYDEVRIVPGGGDIEGRVGSTLVTIGGADEDGWFVHWKGHEVTAEEITIS